MGRICALLLSSTLIFAVALASTPACAQQFTVYDATLGEADQKSIEVSTTELRDILTRGQAVIIDSRPHPEFVNGHIPGARPISGSEEVAIAAVDLLVGGDRNKALVLYCNGPYCQASRRLSTQLMDAGYTNVRRYQLGMPIWRALGGPTAIELDGVRRVFKNDHTAVFLDARPAEDFAKGSLANAKNLTPADAMKVKGDPMPLDDFNTRIIVFGRDSEEAQALAEALSKRPWHNVSYFSGSYEDLSSALER